MLNSNMITKMVHWIQDNHTKVSSHGRIRGSVRDATSQEMDKLHKLIKQEDKLTKTKKRGPNDAIVTSEKVLSEL